MNVFFYKHIHTYWKKKEKNAPQITWHYSVMFQQKKKALKDSQHLKIYTKIIVKDGFAKKHAWLQHLEELGGEIRILGTTGSNLSKCECKPYGYTVSGDGVVHVGVHRHSSPPLQNVEKRRPWSQAPEREYHKHYCS